MVLAGTLTACSPHAYAPLPVPAASPSVIYRTTEGVKRLSYQLNIWAANKPAGMPRIITNATSGGVDGGFKWQLTPQGGTIQLQFNGRNDRMQIPPRSVVQLLIDAQPAFYGIVPDPPSGGSPDSETVTVLGGKEALKGVLSDGTVYSGGIYPMVRDLLSRLLPPSLTYDPALIGDGSGTDAGPSLSTFYKPFQPLTEVLDALAQSAGVSWDVDVQGRVFFGRPQPAALTVGYAGQPWRRLQVQGRETVTRSVVRIVSGTSVPQGARVLHGSSGTGQYLPRTITAAAEAPEHALYRMESVRDVPAGVSVLTPATPSFEGSSGTLTPEAAADGDLNTYASLRIGYGDALVYDIPEGLVVGIQVRYALLLGDQRQSPFDVSFLLSHNGDLVMDWQVEDTQNVVTATAIVPPDATGSNPNSPTWHTRLVIQTAVSTSPLASPVFQLYDVRMLTVDDVAAQRLAASYLQLPYSSPAELTLPYLASPTPSLTVTGSPDGTLTGETSLWEYEHSADNARTTRIKLGSSGQADTARAIKFLAQAQAREVVNR